MSWGQDIDNWFASMFFNRDNPAINQPAYTAPTTEDHSLTGNIRATSSNVMIIVAIIGGIYLYNQIKK